MLKTENSLVDEAYLGLSTYLQLEHHCSTSEIDIWDYLRDLQIPDELSTQLDVLVAQRSSGDITRFTETIKLHRHTQGSLDSVVREALQHEHVDADGHGILKDLSLTSPDDQARYASAQHHYIEKGAPHDRALRREASSTTRSSESSIDVALTSPHKTHRYQHISTLGRGGSGVVTQAFDRTLKRDVAIKFIKSGSEQHEAVLQREAQLTSTLEHPNIIPIYDWVSPDEVEGGDQFSGGYSMRVTEHETLSDYLRSNTTINLYDACSILKQVALALDYAHQRGVIHRDVKPSNILLGRAGEVYLTDWGIALWRRNSEVEQHVHVTDLIAGTPAYMPPEQLSNDLSKVGPHSDVYSLGVTLYQVLTRHKPFKGRTLIELFHNILHAELTPPSSYMLSTEPLSHLNSSIEKICLKMLARDPLQRFRSAREVVDALDQALSGVQYIEHQRQLAREAIAQGDRERAECRQLTRRMISLQKEIKDARKQYRRELHEDARRSLWRLEEEYDHLLIPQEEALARSTYAYQNATRLDESTRSQEALAELFWDQLIFAESQEDQRRGIYFEEQLRALNIESIHERLDRPSQLSLMEVPAHTKIEIWSERLTRYRVEAELVYQSDTPNRLECVFIELPRGVYRLVAEHPHAYTTTFHFMLNRGAHRELYIRLPRKESIAQGFTYVPTCDGASGLAFMSAAVTCQEYFGYLNQLPNDVADRHAPRYQDQLYVSRDAQGRFSLPFVDKEGDQWLPDWPVFLVNYDDVLSYASWRGGVLNKPARLPTADEWLWAAQGSDDRPYPWGLSFDPSLCHMRDSIRSHSLPVPVKSYPLDRSPFGVYDVAGNMAQWTSDSLEGEPELKRVCGASFNSMDFLCALSVEMSAPRSNNLSHLGFRLVYDLNPERDYL